MLLSEKAVEKLKAGPRRLQIMDDQTTGFGLRCDVNGRKSFCFYGKVNGQQIFKSLGEWPAVSVKDARDAARVWSGKAIRWKQDGCPEDKNPFAKKPKQARTSVPTFKELLEAYIERHVRKTALHPERAEYDVRLLVKKYLSSWLEVPVDKIRVDDVLRAKNACKGPYMANSVVDVTKRIFNWSTGSKDGKLNFWKVTANPAADIAKNPHEKRARFLDADELVRFHRELDKEPDQDTKDVLSLLLATGARKGNVFEMGWADISFERQQWDIPRSKNGFGYTIELTPIALKVLERRRDEREEGAVWVFPSHSRSGHIEDVKKRWIALRKRANLPGVRLHDLRRTKASWAVISGESLQKAGALLGHRTIASTAIYARLSQESVRQASLASDAEMAEKMKAARKRMVITAKKSKPKPKLLAMAGAK